MLQSENVSSVSPACRKRRIKREGPCRCSDGHGKNPTKCLWRLEPDRRSNFLLRSACTSVCRRMYDWNIVDCDVKQPIDLSPKARHRNCWQIFSLWPHNQMARQVVAQLWRHNRMTSKGQHAAPHALNLARGQFTHSPAISFTQKNETYHLHHKH